MNKLPASSKYKECMDHKTWVLYQVKYFGGEERHNSYILLPPPSPPPTQPPRVYKGKVGRLKLNFFLPFMILFPKKYYLQISIQLSKKGGGLEIKEKRTLRKSGHKVHP